MQILGIHVSVYPIQIEIVCIDPITFFKWVEITRKKEVMLRSSDFLHPFPLSLALTPSVSFYNFLPFNSICSFVLIKRSTFIAIFLECYQQSSIPFYASHMQKPICSTSLFSLPLPTYSSLSYCCSSSELRAVSPRHNGSLLRQGGCQSVKLPGF